VKQNKKKLKHMSKGKSSMHSRDG